MKKVIRIVDREGAGFDATYWKSKSSQQRIDALEQLRQQQLMVNGIRQRLQRVYRIIESS